MLTNIARLLKRNFRFSSVIGNKESKVLPCTAKSVEKHCLYDMCSIPKDIQQPTVIIIGAGMSGLSAGKRLVQCGLTNFRILEALERPGGRIRTCFLGDTIIEMGAEHISGASIANSVYTLAAQEGLFSAPLKRIDSTLPLFLTSDGRAIDLNVAKKASNIFEALKSKASKVFFTDKKMPKDTVSNYFEQLFLEELQKLPETERYDSARIFYGMSNGLKSKVGADLDKVSSASFGSFHELPGGDVRIPVGMTGLLAPLIRELPEDSVKYCKPVYTIRWGTAGSGIPRAIVKCCDGETYPADYVIVTVPLGVLKHKSESLFCPALPAKKEEAIKKLGFGHVNKIFVQQETPFWAGDNEGFLFAWSPQELSNKTGWIKGITGFKGVYGSQKVITATVSGEEAMQMEQKSDEIVVNDLRKVLQMFLGDSTLPPPKEIMRSDWSTNPYFYGAYTYLSVESNVGHIHSLAEPLPDMCDDLPPIIFFAGEHTSCKYFSTLHGAREAGIREADRIIALTKKFIGPPNKGPPCIPCETCPI